MIIKFYLDTKTPGDSANLQKIFEALSVSSPRVTFSFDKERAPEPESEDVPDSVSGAVEASINRLDPPVVAKIEQDNSISLKPDPERPEPSELPTDEEIKQMPLADLLDVLSKTDEEISEFAIRWACSSVSQKFGAGGIAKIVDLFRESFGKSKLDHFEKAEYRDLAAALKLLLETKNAR